MLNKLCSLEWELTRRYRSRSAILFGKKMRRLNQISRTYSFESTRISIWFGACKMRRLNRALSCVIFVQDGDVNNSNFIKAFHKTNDIPLR